MLWNCLELSLRSVKILLARKDYIGAYVIFHLLFVGLKFKPPLYGVTLPKLHHVNHIASNMTS